MLFFLILLAYIFIRKKCISQIEGNVHFKPLVKSFIPKIYVLVQIAFRRHSTRLSTQNYWSIFKLNWLIRADIAFRGKFCNFVSIINCIKLATFLNMFNYIVRSGYAFLARICII